MAEEVAERAAEQERRGEAQEESLDDPLLRGERAAEVLTDRGERNVHDGAVEEHEARRQRAGGQRAARVARAGHAASIGRPLATSPGGPAPHKPPEYDQV